MSKEIQVLLAELEKVRGKKGSDSPEARAIRIKLRKLGYSLRQGAMKTEDEEEPTTKEAPKKIEAKKSKKVVEEEEDEDEEEEDA